MPRFNFGDAYDLKPSGKRGLPQKRWSLVWGSSLPSPSRGPWYNRANFDENRMYYSGLLLVDDDDDDEEDNIMCVVYGNGQVKISPRTAAQTVESSRISKVKGAYYTLNGQLSSTTCVWKSSSPWAPYEAKILVPERHDAARGRQLPAPGQPRSDALAEDWHFIVTDDIYSARATPSSTASIADFSKGNRRGRVCQPRRQRPARARGARRRRYPVPSGASKVWSRAELDARPTGTKAAEFFYSFDGKRLAKLGPSLVAYRFGIFNFATNQLGRGGGSVKVQ
ncbi:hypothetical protein CSUB01_10362 [Colletotrichum sublineola]|uniref:Uncharacterized protein n=1 Tax=Colletotrichum sublineola TaxID=1173701 RepID=A0A066XRA9_COLSU|nr:hypothetical protein CSUB01_10362 [Colletotrichum sublineola]